MHVNQIWSFLSLFTLLLPSQIQLEWSLPFQIEVFQYTVLEHYLSRSCCQNIFSSYGTYIFSLRTIGVA
jgi:hypothetical protein